MKYSELHRERETCQMLEARGYAPEMVGGGGHHMARRFPFIGWIWASCEGGGGVPDDSGWTVCAYPANWDGEPEDQLPFSETGTGRFDLVLATLSAELALFQIANDLPRACALESLMGLELTPAQRDYLSKFCDDWDKAQARSDCERNGHRNDGRGCCVECGEFI